MSQSHPPTTHELGTAQNLRTQIKILLGIALVLHLLLAMYNGSGTSSAKGSTVREDLVAASMLAIALTLIGWGLVAATHRRAWAWRQLWLLMLLWSVLGAAACLAVIWEEVGGGRVLLSVRWKTLLIGSLPFPLQPFLVVNIAHYRRQQIALSDTFD